MPEKDPDKSQQLKTLLTHPEVFASRTVPLFKVEGEAPKNGLEKILSLFADVRAGEGIGVVLMMMNIFLVLGAYYLLKTARESLILTEQSAEVKSYSAAGQAIVLLMLVPLYGWVATKVNRVKLVAGLTLFFVSHLAVFSLMGATGVKEGVVFYIWVGVFNLFVISQFWAFANDLYTEGQGRRLFPLIVLGSSLGALAGAQAAEHMFGEFKMSPYSLMTVAGVVLVFTAALLAYINAREAKQTPPDMMKEASQPLSTEGAFELIRDDRYLLWIALLTVLLNLVNTNGEYLLGRMLTEQAAARGLAGAAAKQFIGSYYAGYFTWVNALSLILQAFGVSRIIRHVGIRGSMFFMPILGLLSYSVLAVAPVLRIVKAVKIMENAADYSVQNTVRQALWLPTTREAKYKAKAAVDTLFARSGDVLSAGVVYVGAALMSLGTSGFAWINVLLIIAWLWVAAQIAREHRKRTV
jgi:ATP:ADP antiporter, AAA family